MFAQNCDNERNFKYFGMFLLVLYLIIFKLNPSGLCLLPLAITQSSTSNSHITRSVFPSDCEQRWKNSERIAN